jgi:hypothetical protein
VPLGDGGLPADSTLRKPRAFQTPAVFDYLKGEPEVLLSAGE